MPAMLARMRTAIFSAWLLTLFCCSKSSGAVGQGVANCAPPIARVNGHDVCREPFDAAVKNRVDEQKGRGIQVRGGRLVQIQRQVFEAVLNAELCRELLRKHGEEQQADNALAWVKSRSPPNRYEEILAYGQACGDAARKYAGEVDAQEIEVLEPTMKPYFKNSGTAASPSNEP